MSESENNLTDAAKRLLLFMKSNNISGYKIHKEIPTISEQQISHIRNGRNDVSLDIATKISNQYNVSLNWLLIGEGDMLKQTSNAKPLTDIEFMNVPLVPVHAQAGYPKGYGDQEYIAALPTIPVIVDKNYHGMYRVFEVDGDSMDDGTRNALIDKDKVLCREIKRELWQYKLHFNDWFFVIVHKTEGVTLKQITDHNVETGEILCHPLNSLFNDFTLNLNDVVELYNVIKIVERNARI